MIFVLMWALCGLIPIATIFSTIGKEQLDEMIEQQIGSDISKTTVYIVMTIISIVLGPFNFILL